VRKDSYKALSLAAVILAVCSLTLGYAALTQTLNINVGGTVQSGTTTWNIHFENNGKSATKVGNAVLGTMDLKQTTITLSGVTLKTAGDSVTYSFNVVNDGELDAMISVLTPTEVTVTGGTTTEQNALKQAVEYTLKYADGTEVGLNDSLLASEEKEMLLTISLKAGTTLPSSNVSISNIGYTITYVQKTSGGGSSDTGLNEYGFYYGKKYTMTTSFNSNDFGDVITQSTSFTFYDDGSAEINSVANEGEGSYIFEMNEIIWHRNSNLSPSFTAINNGTQLKASEEKVYTLTSTPTSQMNEYGFYFGEEYGGLVDGTPAFIIVYENGSMDQIMRASYPKDSLTYELGKVFAGDVLMGTFSVDGKQFIDSDNIIYTLDEEV